MQITKTIPETVYDITIDRSVFPYNPETKELSIKYYLNGKRETYTFTTEQTEARTDDDAMIRIMCDDLGFTVSE
jgi:hypothetical protein